MQRVGNIYIGQPYEETVQILGAPFKRETYSEIYFNYKQFGFNPEKILVFYLEFDYAIEYDQETNIGSDPIYKIFFKDNKVQYIIFSSYIYEGLIDIYEWNDVQIFSERKKLLKQFGEGYEYEDFSPKDYDGEYCYFEKGVSLISKKEIVRAVHIFPPMNKKQVNKYKRWKTIEIISQ